VDEAQSLAPKRCRSCRYDIARTKIPPACRVAITALMARCPRIQGPFRSIAANAEFRARALAFATIKATLPSARIRPLCRMTRSSLGTISSKRCVAHEHADALLQDELPYVAEISARA